MGVALGALEVAGAAGFRVAAGSAWLPASGLATDIGPDAGFRLAW